MTGQATRESGEGSPVRSGEWFAALASPRDGWPRPLIAIAPVLLALGAQLLLWPWIKPYAWFLFFPAVFAAAWLGGVWAGLRATLLSVVVVCWFFVAPEYSLAKHFKDYFAAVAFVGLGVALTFVQESIRRANQRLLAANEQITSLYERTRELDVLKSQFFANISHELRTPLALILGPIERLRALTPDNNVARRDLEVVHRNARLLAQRVDDLLDAAKLDAGKLEVQYREIDLATLVRLVSSYYSAHAAEREIGMVIRAEQPIRVHADPAKLQRVLINLLSNAMKFTPDGGIVRIEARYDADADTAQVEIADSGPGIPSEHRDAVFDRFHQLDGAATRRFGGTGLGLSIVRELVHLHRGTVDVIEAPEGGAMFVVRVPTQAPPGVVATPNGGEFATGASGPEVAAVAVGLAAYTPHTTAATEFDAADPRPLVLVVEDDRDMNHFICEALRDAYQVMSAFDGLDGLALERRLNFDLVLTDVMMPELSGDQLLRAIRSDSVRADLPVVVITAKGDEETRVRLLRDGASDYLVKPFAVEELRARVGNLAAVARTTAELRRSQAAATELAAASQAAQEAVQALNLDLRGANEQLRLTTASAETANQAKSDFLARMSHELRTPLNAIVGFTQLLALDELTDEQREGVTFVLAASDHLLDLINEVLDLARIEAGLIAVSPEPVLLLDTVRDTLALVEPLARTRGVTLHLNPDAAPRDGYVYADPQRVKQVLLNVLSNAIKYNRPAGRVDVSLTITDDGCIRTRIADTGTGINPDHMDKLFEPFERLGAEQSEVEGTGLGLALSQALLEAMGGSIAVEATSNRGTTVVIDLVGAADPDSNLGPQQPPERDRGRSMFSTTTLT